MSDEPATPPDAPDQPGGLAGPDLALVAEAAQKSGLLWVRPSGGRDRAAWHVWVDGRAYVVGGGEEQDLPELSGPVTVVLRSKETRARLVRLTATAERVHPGDPDWGPATEALKGARLNAADTATLVDRWAVSSVVTRLTPVGPLLEGPGRYDVASGSATPAGSSGRSSARLPWHLGGRLRRAERRAARARRAAARGQDQR